MKGYILSIAGIILISAILNAITPKGKLGDFIKGIGKLLVLTVIVAPFITNLKKGDFPFLSASITEDTAYLTNSAELLERKEENALEKKLLDEFGVDTEAEITVAQDGTYTFKKISVKICDFGIFGQEEHINIISRIQKWLLENYGCDVEVDIAESAERE